MRDRLRHSFDTVRTLTPPPFLLQRPPWQRLVSSALAWSVALAATVAFTAHLQRSIFIFFWVAILFTAWNAGFFAALLASVASVVAVNWFFIEPVHLFTVPDVSDALMLLTFVIVSAAVSALTTRLSSDDRSSRRRAAELSVLTARMAEQQHELARAGDAARALLREVEETNQRLATANASLSESERRWQSLADSAPVFIWTAGEDGQVEWFNVSWLAFTGRALEESGGGRWLEAVHPSDRGAVASAHADAYRARRTFVVEYRLRRHDGTYCWFLEHGAPRLAADGSLLGFIGSCIDITDRRRAEEHARALESLGLTLTHAFSPSQVMAAAAGDAAPAVEAHGTRIALLAPDGVSLVPVATDDEDGANAVALQLAVADVPSPERDAVRSAMTIVLSSREVVRARYGDQQAAELAEAGAESIVTIPLTIEGRAVGVLRFLFAEAREFQVDDMAFMSAVAHQCAQALDRVRLFDAEREARKEADAANRAKSDFLAQLSHELRTPLNAVGGYADLIAMGIHGPVSDAQRTALARLKRAQQELLTHIDELLTFARIDRGHPNYAFEQVEAAPVLREVEALTLPQAGAKRITLLVEEGPPSLAAWADRDRVRQVLLNLATNAIKYTHPGGRVVLSVHPAVGGEGEQRVDFEVADSGRGIPEEMLERIFDPFVQLKKGTLEPREGVGLGLAISRRLAADMEGTLTVQSEVAVGSSFRFSLPSSPGRRERDRTSDEGARPGGSLTQVPASKISSIASPKSAAILKASPSEGS